MDFRCSLSTASRITKLFLGKKPSALIPVVMSLLALTLIAIRVSIHGVRPERDKGVLAHRKRFGIPSFA